MKNRNIHYRKAIPALLIALVLGCFALSQAMQAGGNRGNRGNHGNHGIVGLWDVLYTSNYTGPLFHTHDQWHSDGLEFEVNGVAPGAMCQGTWENGPHGSVQLFHVGFVFNPDGSLQGPFTEAQTNTVSHDGNSYDGTYDTKYYGPDGTTLLIEDKGTMHATRLSVGDPL